MRKDALLIFLFSLIIGFIARQQYLQNLMIPLALVAIVGTCISLLLAFRTGQSYDRWWEARIVWGAIVNDSRSLIRQLQLFLPSDKQKDVEEFAERQAIWCYALGEALRKQPHSQKVQDYIAKHSITDSNIPNAILSLHSKHLKRLVEAGNISEFREVQIDVTLVKLCDSMGKCERIKNTIFPVNYGKLIHLLIYSFAFILPFSLDDNFLFFKIVLTVFIPLFFLIIERTAILMQDPFENEPMDTPITSISQTIEMNLMQMVGKEGKEPDVPNDDYYYIL